MIVVWGTRLYGKVDRTPSGVHVATRFFHMQFFPLIPMGSVIVLRGDNAVKAPFSFKSMLVGYVRSAGFVFGVFGAIFAVVMMGGGASNLAQGAIMLGMSAMALGVAIGSYFIPGIGRATEARIAEMDKYLERVVGRAGMARSHAAPAGAGARRRTAARRKLAAGGAAAAAATPPAANQQPLPPQPELQPVAQEPAEEEVLEEEVEDGAFVVACPSCEAEVEVDMGMAGKTVECPECDNAMQIPSIT